MYSVRSPRDMYYWIVRESRNNAFFYFEKLSDAGNIGSAKRMELHPLFLIISLFFVNETKGKPREANER